jgi:hypothetical protein
METQVVTAGDNPPKGRVCHTVLTGRCLPGEGGGAGLTVKNIFIFVPFLGTVVTTSAWLQLWPSNAIFGWAFVGWAFDVLKRKENPQRYMYM